MRNPCFLYSTGYNQNITPLAASRLRFPRSGAILTAMRKTSSIEVMYYAMGGHEMNKYDFEQFITNVHGVKDIEALCLQCGITREQMHVLQNYHKLPKRVLVPCRGVINWTLFESIEYDCIDDKMASILKDHIIWGYAADKCVNVSESTLEKICPDHIAFIGKHRLLSFEFMDRHIRELNWLHVTYGRVTLHGMTDEFVSRYKEHVHWFMVSKASDKFISLDFIRKWSDYLDWNSLSAFYPWDSRSIREFKDRLEPSIIHNRSGFELKLNPDEIRRIFRMDAR